MSVSRPVLRWHGGKWRLAPWIIRQFPPHRVYTEVFGGAGSVLLRKPRAYSEVYNDLDGEVCHLFKMLQRPDTSALIKMRLRNTPFAREEFNAAYESSPDPIERACNLIIRSFMGFGSNASNEARSTGFRANSNRSGTTPAHDWAHYPDCLDAIIDRLRGVVIENRPASEVLEQHDGPDTLHYVDPPYVHETRKPGNEDNYKHEMTDADHRALAVVLRGLGGGIVLSGYPCPLYDQELYPDWHRVERSALADGAAERTEVLWINDTAWTQSGRLF